MAKIIDGRRVAAEIRKEVKAATDELRRTRGVTPGLAFCLVGDNPASQVYVGMKGKACTEVGFYSITEIMAASTSEKALLAKIQEFNRNPSIHGILVQLPLPAHIRERVILEAVNPAKDVDGFHPFNVGQLVIGNKSLRPCTPAGIQELLIRSGIDTAGKHVVVVGRSNIVGKPIANILLQKAVGANAIVTVVHTGTSDIGKYTRTADILIAAIGKPRFITGDMIKAGAVVIDVGTNRIEDPSASNNHRLVGDVDFESASKVAGAISPVPGGVGPMTIAMLLKNTLEAATAASSDQA
jgi:methylenetetrahydrofolate dehydrogenase (NADP+)/methenyltetrahydrofolate cyclohydrolase